MTAHGRLTWGVFLADWVAAKGKNLTNIYITHGHPDHWFGASVLLDRFPAARMVAMPAVVRQMRRYITPDALPLWQQRFPSQVPDRLVVADELPGTVIGLEGQELVAMELGHTDTDGATCLHVPSIGLVVAGHKKLGRADEPGNIDETRGYIRAFEQALAEEDTALGVYQNMIARYPDRAFPAPCRHPPANSRAVSRLRLRFCLRCRGWSAPRPLPVTASPITGISSPSTMMKNCRCRPAWTAMYAPANA